MAANDEILKKMLQSKLFEYMSMDEAESLYAIAKHVHFKKGDYIIRENDEGDEFYWVLNGRIEIEITATNQDQKKVQLNTIQDGDLLGEMVLLGKNRRTANAIARTDCELVAWECAACFKIFNNNYHLGFRLMNNFAQILSNRIHEMNLRLRNTHDDFKSEDLLRLIRSS